MAASSRDAEVTERLTNLIEILMEDAEDGIDYPPEEAAATWTEAEVRAYFRSGECPQGPANFTGGEEEEPTVSSVVPGLPGGGRPQSVRGEPSNFIREDLTPQEYLKIATEAGIRDRPNGLFPPDDPVLQSLASDPNLIPFQKHCAHPADGSLGYADGSWGTGDAAARNGLDFRYFYDRDSIGTDHPKLVGAVRFGEGAAIGRGFGTTAHGGSIETVLDEATAEAAKVSLAATATTSTISFKIAKPVPLHTTLLVRAAVESTASRGLRINTTGHIEGPEDPAAAEGRKKAAVVYATCEAQLIDMAKFQAMSSGGA